MTQYCINPSQFHKGQNIFSLVYYPPIIIPGTYAQIVSHYKDNLYAVQLPNGELYRWFTSFELKPVDESSNQKSLEPGDYATVISIIGHFPNIEIGTKVKVVKTIAQVYFYDVMLHGTEYHRWLAEFEIAQPVNK